MLEDGVAREVRVVPAGRGAGDDRHGLEAGAGSGRPGQPDPLRQITLVTLVFDHLSQNGRASWPREPRSTT